MSTLDNHGRNPLHLAQSKLKLLAKSKSDSSGTLKVKLEIQQIIEMMLEYLQKKGQDEEAELLTAFANRLTLSTPEQVNEDVTSLLANLSSLSLGSTGKQKCSSGRDLSSSPFSFKQLAPMPASELKILEGQISAPHTGLTSSNPSNPWRTH